jgi:hypothetical protein
MWLRALAGAYAGQVRDFRTDVGLQALRSGTAERVDVVHKLTPLEQYSIDVAHQMTAAAALVPVVEKTRKRKK